MAQYKVQGPDGTLHTIEGPDGATDEEIIAQAKTLLGPTPNPAKEAGQVVGKIAQDGVMGMPGFIGDVGLAAARNVDKAPWTPLTASMKLARMIPGAKDAIDNTKFGDVSRTLKTLGGLIPEAEPETETGKTTANIGSSVLGTVLTGGTGTVLGKAATGLSAGVGGELAAHATNDNPIARFLGALLGGSAVSAWQAFKPNSQTLVRQATQHMTPEDWNKAKVLEATLNNEGIDHLKSQLLGPRSTLADQVMQAGTNSSVGPRLRTKVAESSDQAKGAVDRWADTNTIITAGSERRELLSDIQKAATQAVREAKQRGNTAFENVMPAKDLQYPQDRAKGIYEELMVLAKDPKYSKPTGETLAKFARNLVTSEKLDLSGVNPTVLLRAKAAGVDLSTLPGAKMVQEFETSAHRINNLIKGDTLKGLAQDGYTNLPVKDIRTVVQKATPEFDAARAAKTNSMLTDANPLESSLAGDLAHMGGGPKLTRYTAKDTSLDMVFPKDKAQPNEILGLEKALGGDGVATLLREYIGRASGRSFAKDLPENMTQQPFNFSKAITGTQEQRANLDAALHVTAKYNGVNPAAVREGFHRLIDALDTFASLKLPTQIDRASLSQEAGKNWMSFAVAPNSRIGRFRNEVVMTKTYNQIADMVTSKNGLQQLEAIAKSPKRDAAQTLAASILSETMQSKEFQGKTP